MEHFYSFMHRHSTYNTNKAALGITQHTDKAGEQAPVLSAPKSRGTQVCSRSSVESWTLGIHLLGKEEAICKPQISVGGSKT